MKLAEQIAKHFRQVYFGGNWTSVSMKEILKDVNWREATTQIHSFNTIAALVFHINYYISAVLKVLQGEPLNASDKYSFDCPRIQGDEEWQKLLDKTWKDAEVFATLVQQLPESKFEDSFSNEKCGNYYTNIHGIIEHTHYHLGQIVFMKKLVRKQKQQSNK
jgi:hypothetical protein